MSLEIEGIPMPGEQYADRGTVIASSFYVEADFDAEVPADTFIVILLNRNKPFYTVAEVSFGEVTLDVIASRDFENIVFAAEAYRDWSGCV